MALNSKQTYLVHYGELGLKGQNRPIFEKTLMRNIHAVLRDLGEFEIRRFRSYILVETEASVPADVIERRLSGVAGIAYFAPVAVVPQEMAEIEETALRMAQEVITPETSFEVNARRSDKSFPVYSPEVNRRVGALIVEATGAPVDLGNPDVTVHIQIYPKGVYIFARRIDGPGGLPVGTGGRVMALLSGGIDSPVAAHMMLRRGCDVTFLHFHMLRSSEDVRQSKVVKLARAVMAPHRLSTVVYMAPVFPYQMAVLEHDSRVELVVFRRFILRVAAYLAREEERALALVTGDNLGQVASQTLKNLHVTARAVEMPVLRPLVAYDKQEIVALAKQIGTFELSIEPYKDPCSIQARRPATWAQMSEVRALEAALDMDAIMAETLAGMEKVPITWES